MPINVVSGDLPGDTLLKFDFEQPPYNMQETAAVFFRVHVGLNTPADTTLSLQGKFTFPGATQNDVTTYTNIVSFDIMGAQALDGFMRATPWLDQGFIGVMEAGESMTYSTVITNTGYAMSSLVLNGLADAHTRLIPGSVTSNIGTIELGNAEGDTEVRIALDHFPLGATAAFTYAVTFPASIDNNVKSVTGRAVLTDEASEDPYLVLTHETPFGPIVRLVADLGDMSGEIDPGDGTSYSRRESITITNQGPVDVTGVTVRIQGLGYSIRPNEPITCPDVTPRFCREDGTAACADNSACKTKVELQSFVYPGILKVGEKFVINWQIQLKSDVKEIMTYQLDMTSTTVEAKPRPVELTVRLQRVLVTYELDDGAMSPWAALLALIAAAVYLARKKQQAA